MMYTNKLLNLCSVQRHVEVRSIAPPLVASVPGDRGNDGRLRQLRVFLVVLIVLVPTAQHCAALGKDNN